MIKKILPFVLFLSFALLSKAQVINFSNSATPLKGTAITAGAVITVLDNVNWNPSNPYWYYDFSDINTINRVSLRYRDNAQNYYASAWDVQVVFRYDTYNTSNAIVNQQTVTLKVNYNNVPGSTHTPEQVYFDKSKVFGYKTVITVLSVTPSAGFVLPNELELISEIEVERYKYTFNPVAVTAPTISYNAATNKINFNWSPVANAVEYDLEWLFVPEENTSLPPTGKITALVSILNEITPATYYDPSLSFAQATRVTVKNNNYSISNIHDDGYIVFRVRQASKNSYINEKREVGYWSGVTTSQVLDISNSYEFNRNWKYSIEYAEEGKQKETIAFFDGTGRNRQSLVGLNTDNNALVSESFYDYEGRAVAQTLPAPLSTFTNLKFYDQFTLNAAGNPFGRKDIDNDLVLGACVTSIPAMNDGYGASQYYSDKNPDKDGKNAAIPDANDYPYTHTLYGPDGRLRSQSLPGKTHTTGSGRETRYFYGTPTQEKLDRLFGNDVGFASQYTQKAIVDANGQLSVSYIDMDGHTIATALAGDTPATLDALPSNVAATSVTASFASQNTYSVTDGGYVMRSNFLVTNPNTAYQFSYSLTPAQYVAMCGETGGKCSYRLNVTITDQCNTSLINKVTSPSVSVNGGAAVTNNKILDQTFKIDGTTLTASFTVTFPSVGTYTINKKLLINDSIAKVKVAAFSNYLHTNTNNSCVNKTSIQTKFDATADNAACNDVVDETDNSCDDIKELLKIDLSPGGQYFENAAWLTTYVVNATPSFWTVFNNFITSAGTCLTCGDKAPLATNTWAEVRNRWQDGYADFLVTYHPEYCVYTRCVQLQTSKNLDALLAANEQLSWATSNPAAGLKYINNTDNPKGVTVLNNDPFFNTIAPSYKAGMLAYMQSGVNLGSTFTGSIWSVSDQVAKSPSTDPETPACVADCDETWRTFVTIYLTKKNEYIKAWMTANGCVAPTDANTDEIAEAPANAQGFMIRFPNKVKETKDIDDLGVPPNVTATTDLSNTLKDKYNVCKKAASAIVSVSNALPGSTLIVPPGWIITVNGLAVSNALNEFSTTPILLKALPKLIVDKINQLVTTTDYTAELVPGSDPNNFDYDKVRIIAPASYGASFNGLTIGAETAPPGGTSFSGGTLSGGLDDSPCGTEHDCFCEQIRSLNNLYNAKNPADGSFYISHTTYTTADAYVKTALKATVPLAADKTAIDNNYATWKTYCLGSNPARGGITPTPPAALACDQVTPCGVAEKDERDFYVNVEFERKLDSLIAAYMPKYRANCFSGVYNENFTVTYADKEYHYTLYYYDQAGNLIRTVPPVGVAPITLAADLTKVKNFRNKVAGATAFYPTHTKVTAYRYNTMNQLIWQKTPDAGISTFLYDRLGRMVISQSAKQKPLSGYSYTSYDQQNRIKVLGEITFSAAPTQNNISAWTADANGNIVYTYDWFTQYGSNTRNATYTFYDDLDNITNPDVKDSDPSVNPFTDRIPSNLRNRVIASIYSEGADPVNYNTATYYSYDEHGNVKDMVQDNKFLIQQSITGIETQRYKLINYQYDLISDKVKALNYQSALYYQQAFPDQFYHRYTYDADNRLTGVKTSRDKVIWADDARYDYYKHGPLARMELGDEKVQGLDYAYTINGWIKAVNSNLLSPVKDLGKDGLNEQNFTLASYTGGNAAHGAVAADAFGYSLDYFNKDVNNLDYQAANTLVGSAILADITALPGTTNNRDLYNGNIKTMVTSHMTKSSSAAIPTIQQPIASRFVYDQLNRIKGTTPYMVGVNFAGSSAANNLFTETFNYDADGNFIGATRNGNTAGALVAMDNFTYNYTAGTNQLKYVQDNPANSSNYTDDIDNQSATNYSYDLNGNLLTDVQSKITAIDWSPYGKINNITFNDVNKPNMLFRYDANGKRIFKQVGKAGGTSDQTIYVRDVKGNILATYTATTEFFGWSLGYATYKMAESNIYGIGRIGTLNRDEDMLPTPVPKTIYERVLGNRRYELANHLSNVIATISDRKVKTQSNRLDYFTSFENYPNKTTGVAYSGTASCKLFSPTAEYSPSLLNEQVQAGDVFTVSIKARYNDALAARGILVVALTGPNGNFLKFSVGGSDAWLPTYVGAASSNNWATYTFNYTIPSGLIDNGVAATKILLGCNVWNNNVNPVYIDDMTISLVHNGTLRYTQGLADITSSQDYYVFGAPMPGRNYTSATGYRYGFNGKENDNEVKNVTGSQQDYGMRIYDSRVGRFLSVDPITRSYPMLTPYQFASNNPIWATDLDGLEANLAIYSIGVDGVAFKYRAQDVSDRLKTMNFTPHPVSSGKQFIQLLKDQTKQEGSIQTLVTFSHAWENGLSLNPGNLSNFATINPPAGFNASGFANFKELEAAVNSKEIVFEKGATIILGGCNCGNSEGAVKGKSLAETFAEKVGVTVIGADGGFSPVLDKNKKETGKYSADNGFYKFERQEDGSVKKTSLGKTIDIADYIKNNTTNVQDNKKETEKTSN